MPSAGHGAGDGGVTFHPPSGGGVAEHPAAGAALSTSMGATTVAPGSVGAPTTARKFAQTIARQGLRGVTSYRVRFD